MLIPASAMALVIFAPSPRRFVPSTRNAATPGAGLKPATAAAAVALRPFTGARKTIPAPGLSGWRRATTISRSVFASASCRRTPATAPGWSWISPDHTDHTSIFVTFEDMLLTSARLLQGYFTAGDERAETEERRVALS